MKATNATVAKAAAISSRITAIEKIKYDFPVHAKTANKRLVNAIKIPATKRDLKTPVLMVKKPPIKVKIIVVIHPNAFEKIPISDFEKPISL